jgi:N-methylhydantoinase B
VNLTEATTLAAAYGGVLNNVEAGIPRNAGSLGRVHVQMRSGAVVGRPAPGVGTSVATTNVCDRLFNAISLAFAKAGQPWGLAAGSTGILPNLATISGVDPRRADEPFIQQTPIGFGGGPALQGHDGWLTYNKPATGGVIRSASVEQNELRAPILYSRIELVADSGGPGEWEGAPSVLTEYGPRFGPMLAAYVGDSCTYPPEGACGGAAGRRGEVAVRRSTAAEPEAAPSVGTVRLEAGETIISTWPGGGGYGRPLRRDPELVLRSVRAGLVSAQHARAVYGVVVDLETEPPSVDREATDAERRSRLVA